MGRMFSDREKLERLWAFNDRFERMQQRKQQDLKRSEAYVPLDWQRNKSDMGEEPTEQAGQKRFYKIKRDVVEKLIMAGRLKEEYRGAVQDIRRIWAAMGRGLSPGVRQLDGVVVDGRAAYRDPLERMSELESYIYTHRYKPWAEVAGKMAVREGRPETLLSLTVDVVVDNQGVNQWEKERRYPMGRTATKCLAVALALYLETG